MGLYYTRAHQPPAVADILDLSSRDLPEESGAPRAGLDAADTGIPQE